MTRTTEIRRKSARQQAIETLSGRMRRLAVRKAMANASEFLVHEARALGVLPTLLVPTPV